MQGEQPPTSPEAELLGSRTIRSATPGQSAAPPRVLAASDAGARPMTLDYGKPAHPATLAHALMTHVTVVVCGCCLAILHAGCLASRSISHFYFHRGNGACDCNHLMSSVLHMPMSLLDGIGLSATNLMIAFFANSLLWGIGIAYAVYWGLCRLRRWSGRSGSGRARLLPSRTLPVDRGSPGGSPSH